jgi:hypothetical protein
MMDWLDRLRQKPKTVRDKAAFFGAAAVTGLIAFGWVTTLPGHFATIDSKDSPEKEAVGAFSKFFSEAKANLASAIVSTKVKSEEEKMIATSTDEKNVVSNQINASSSQKSVTMPDLSKENVEVLNYVKPRVVIISTTTATSSSN